MTLHYGLRSRALLIAVLFACGATAVAATPTPEPGGANAVSGVNGTLSQVLFNGKLRLKKMSLEDAAPSDRVLLTRATDRALMFHAIVSNGTPTSNTEYFNAELADADGVTIVGRQESAMWTLARGTAARVAISFSLPADFVPTRLVLMQNFDKKAKAFRIAPRPNDLEAKLVE